MTAPLASGERPPLRAVAPAPLIAAVPAALAVVGAVSLAPDPVRLPLAWGAGTAAVLLCTAVAVASRAVQTSKLVRRRLGAIAQDAGRLLQERAGLAEEFNQERARLADDSARERARLAKAAARERAHLTEAAAQERLRLTEEFAAEREHLTGELARLAEENARQAERARQAADERAAAISATAGAAARMQALATGTLADLRAMEEKHSDEDVLADLLHLDHRTAQAGRLADSVAVLTGARSGRRWARPIVMESILRGAMGRIGGYQRVRVHSASEATVAGHAAEGVMHALAELLDNAANFSPPTAEVHVYVEEVPAGVIVSVEDSGLVMGDVQLRRAERAVSADAENTAGLGGLTGGRLGLAVVGRLARKHGLKVSFRPSARGGTGVLMLIPQDLLTRPTTPLPAEPEPAAVPFPQVPYTAAPLSEVSYAASRALGDLDPDPVPAHGSPWHEPVPPSASAVNLPKRPRGRALPHATPPPQADPEPRTAADDDSQARAAARFGSFREAVRGAAAGAEEPVRESIRESVRGELAVRDTAPASPAAPLNWNSDSDSDSDPHSDPQPHTQPHTHPEGTPKP
ncbi:MULTISPECIES: ATP-binding protein [Streptomyces]|uniref:histidine kinase n=1 Tax=Streptomyces dengpaensis TaxID=2049881 RepID=A0ABM6STQ9_9ACTN|nr:MULTISPECIES: ATP-binding protein [Streptomyces]AVH58080.1 ATP-binding protein [Streptomyces dengpaensis]PIB06171.1 ATP-binding protein [Streptomyces sp. HG99]